MRNLLTALIVAVAAVLCGAGAASAADKSGYLQDTRGNVIKNPYGECWRTGYWTPAMAIEECDPELVAQPKAAVPGPEKPAVKVTFKGETLFDFDKAVLRPEGKKALDENVVAEMKKHPEVELLLVVGHADRIGTSEYNQKLSERRAAAVKKHLVDQGIAADRVKTEGKGETEPNPDAGTPEKCKGMGKENHLNKKLIECLQPDRRVVVTLEIQ